MKGEQRGRNRLAATLEALTGAPGATAILSDLDGTLAPIVPRPEDVQVPEPTREALRAVAGRYALLAVVTGRRAERAREIVGLDELAYSGNHGCELLLPGDGAPRPDPSLDGHEQDAPRFLAGLDREELDRVGLRSEDKGPIVALHWRNAPNEGEAEAVAAEIESEAEWRGLVPHRGRKVLEIRPNVPINKGIAVASLAAARPIDAALYGGDDRTDVDAFLALRTLREDGSLTTTVAVGVDSPESPPEVVADADLVVEGPPGFLEVLEELVK